ncbi:MAG: hypothetical protein ACKO2G_05940 [Verrucomicrobiales bacterium]
MNSGTAHQPRFLHRLPLDAAVVSLFLAAVLLIETIAILALNNGRFIYTLDDPYIHLAVAENLARAGHYGVNTTEVSSPCSSALWPFLLVPFAGLPIFEFVPLFLNITAGFATAILVLGRVRKWISAERSDLKGQILRAAVVGGFLLGTNIIGLVFTGMEHSLQVLLALMAVEGMLRITEGNPPGVWFAAALILGPWIRYENMAITAPSLAFCFLLGHRRLTFTAGFTLCAGLLLFGFYLTRLGLDPLPSSVAAKSTLAGDSTAMGLLTNLKNSLEFGRGMLVAIATSLLVGFGLAWRGPKHWRWFCVSLATAGFLHLIAGAYGWLHRYEIYILAALALSLASVVAAFLNVSGFSPSRRLGWLVLPLLPVIGFPYLTGLLNLPLAANNIYEQQFQMHCFATNHWKKPVAVNDLGWVAFRNPDHVLDLWGLASPAALKARLADADPAWMEALANDQNVEVVMIYRDWFPKLPKDWREVAVLRLSRKSIISGPKVTFYATKPESIPAIQRSLLSFQNDLPRPEMLEILVHRQTER